MGFFSRIKNAIINFDAYQNFSMEKLSVAIKYFIKLMIIFALIITIAMVIKVYLVGIDNIIASDEFTKYYEMNNWTKEGIIDYLNGNNIIAVYAAIFIVGMIYNFIVYSVLIMIDVLLLAVLGFIVSRIFKINFKFKPILSMSFYALTLSLILYIIYLVANTLTGFEITYFRLGYNLISYIYLITAILTIKSDLIKQQIELMKIIEVQKQVKKDFEERKEEEKKKKEEKKEEEKKDKEGENVGAGAPDSPPKKDKKKTPKKIPEPEGGQAIQ